MLKKLPVHRDISTFLSLLVKFLQDNKMVLMTRAKYEQYPQTELRRLVRYGLKRRMSGAVYNRKSEMLDWLTKNLDLSDEEVHHFFANGEPISRYSEEVDSGDGKNGAGEDNDMDHTYEQMQSGQEIDPSQHHDFSVPAGNGYGDLNEQDGSANRLDSEASWAEHPTQPGHTQSFDPFWLPNSLLLEDIEAGYTSNSLPGEESLSQADAAAAYMFGVPGSHTSQWNQDIEGAGIGSANVALGNSQNDDVQSQYPDFLTISNQDARESSLLPPFDRSSGIVSGQDDILTVFDSTKNDENITQQEPSFQSNTNQATTASTQHHPNVATSSTASNAITQGADDAFLQETVHDIFDEDPSGTDPREVWLPVPNPAHMLDSTTQSSQDPNPGTNSGSIMHSQQEPDSGDQ